MAFVSVGQKYGFVSAGDVFRQKLAEAEKNGEEKAAKARSEGHANAIDVFASLGVSPEKNCQGKGQARRHQQQIKY